MVEFLGNNGWSLVLTLSVVLIWCVSGWGISSKTMPPPDQPGRPEAARSDPIGRWADWQEELSRADGVGDIERLCERWRGQVPKKEQPLIEEKIQREQENLHGQLEFERRMNRQLVAELRKESQAVRKSDR